MKKTLSALLAAVMVFGTMSLTVGATSTASAETSSASSSNGGNSGQIFYQQDFDDSALASLTDYDLADALGWTEPDDTQTMVIENGQLRFVSSLKDSGGAVVTKPYTTQLVKDSQMAGNTIAIEYKFTYQTKIADFEVALSDGSTKTVAKDGQNTDAYVSVNLMKDSDNYITATPFSMGGSMDYTSHVVRNGSKLSIHDSLSADLGEIVGVQHSMKCVIDSGVDGVTVYVDGKPVSTLNYDQRTKWTEYFDGFSDVIGDVLTLTAAPGLDVLIDDLCISEYAPALQISEIMVNGVSAGSYQWIELYNPTNEAVNIYDYCIEVKNALASKGGVVGDEQDVGSYKWQYVTHKDGTVHYKPVFTAGTYDKNGASAVGYFQPGAMTITVNAAAEDPKDRTQTFNSPSYEEGVLQAGETAIAFLPYTAAKGNNPVTDAAVREYMTKLGMPENVKVFACNNEITGCQCEDQTCTDLSTCPNPYQYPFKLAEMTGESMEVAVMRVENTATEEGGYEPVGIGVGRSNEQRFAYFESYAILTAKVAPSGTTITGMMIRKDNVEVPDTSIPLNKPIYQYNQDGTPKLDENGQHIFILVTEETRPTKTQTIHLPIFADRAANLGLTGDHSFEIAYTRYSDETKAQKMGHMQYNSSEVRPTQSGRDLYVSPGFVPPACRNGLAVTAILPDGTQETLVGRLNTEFEYGGTAPDGYSYVGMKLNGSDEVVKSIPAEMMTADSRISVSIVYQRLLPTMVGYQVSEAQNGTFTLRLLAVTDNIKCQSLGFKVKMSWVDAGGQNVTKEFERECYYVYDSVSGSMGTYSADELGGEKLYAYHIDGISTDLANILVEVTPYYVKGYNDTEKHLSTDSTIQFVLNNRPTHVNGSYETNKDNTQFHYDNSLPES